MADHLVNDVFETLLQPLTEKYRAIESVKAKEDGLCEDLRMLLKPWPRAKSEKSANKVCPPVARRDEINKPPEVVLAEKALAKAEKTRSKFKEKIMLLHPEETASDNVDLPVQESQLGSVIQTQSSTTPDPLPLAISESISTELDSAQASVSSVNGTSPSSLNPQPGIAVIPESHLNKLLEPHSGCRGTKDSKMVNPKPTKSVPARTSAGSSKQGVKSHSRYTPVFKSAPFQTEEPVKRQKPGLTRAQMLRANANASKIQAPPSGQGHPVSTSARRPSHKIGQGLSQPRVTSANQKQRNSHFVREHSAGHRVASKLSTTVKEEVCQKSSVLPSHTYSQTCRQSKNTVEVRHGQVKIDSLGVDGLDKRLGKMNLGKLSRNENVNNNGNNNPCDECTEEEEAKKDLPFLLQRDGKSLKLPQKLTRLIGNNRKLRQKLKSAGITKKAQDSVSARDQFLHRMDQYFSGNLTEDQLSQIHNRMKLCDEYRCLSVIFKHICQTSLSEKTSWQTVLKCKRHMEHVFITFTELEDQYCALCKRKDIQVQSDAAFKEIVKKLASRDDVLPAFWLSGKLLPDSLTLSPVVFYEKRQELSEYTSLLHKLQTLAWELYVMEQTAKEVLPYLQQASCDNLSEDFQLYRGAYSMLCSKGTTFPVLVRDSEDSDKSSSDDCCSESAKL